MDVKLSKESDNQRPVKDLEKVSLTFRETESAPVFMISVPTSRKVVKRELREVMSSYGAALLAMEQG